MVEASPEMQQYFQQIELEVKKSYELGKKARKKGLDPEEDISIPLAKNMAERVVGLISVVAPQIMNTTLTERIMELELKYGMLDWRVGFKISEEVAQETFCSFKDKLEALEMGIRVGFAYLTLGIVSAPLEGFIGLKIKKRKDGQEYFALKYAGPIRGAGGTAASTSVLLADYVRLKMGYAKYDPEEIEIKRYALEVQDYHERVTNLQYRPSSEEIKFVVSHLPVEVDGDPTDHLEVSNYKDLPRIETNLIRGGVALVLAEGLCQKAAKLWKKLAKWGPEFGLDWGWLSEFIELKEKIHSQGSLKENKDKKVKPNNTYLMDLVAGRPILTYPLAEGGFRLRYGRGRTCGMYAVGVHPATLIILDKYIAIGTQLKVERPRKGASVTVCDLLEGPIVRLKEGSVKQLFSEEEAKLIVPEIDQILFLGDIMFNFGDFSESGHSLVPVGYCPEWWALELETNETKEGKKILEKEFTLQRLKELINFPLKNKPSFSEALFLSNFFNIPIHPDYTFFWKLISGTDFFNFCSWLKESKLKLDHQPFTIRKIICPYYTEFHFQAKTILDRLGIPHEVVNKENVIIKEKEAQILATLLHFKSQKEIETLSLSNLNQEKLAGKNGLEIINELNQETGFFFRDKAGTFIGARMGRPEKAKMRHLTGSPQVIFPVGEEGDRLRSFQAALEAGKINSVFPLFFCLKCQKEMIYPSCEECGQKCQKRFFCRFCGDLSQDTCRHGPALTYKSFNLDLKYYFEKAKLRLGEKLHPDLIKGIRGTSNKEHHVEHLAKGILRAKYGIYVNKDGTTRYDCTELPLTHFKPKEINTSLEKLKELGYLKDIYGQDLISKEQILELKPQDLILPGFDSLEESAPKVMFKVSQFVDNLLTHFYGLESFYNLKSKEDLAGHLVIALAPHISAGLVGRIIGYSEIQGLLAHPMFHAGLRRDCDGDEAAIMLLLDALLNFSRKYLPNSRGSTMDAPLVLTSLLNPAEVDDQVLDLDTVWRYPLELYEAAELMKFPYEVKNIQRLGERLGTSNQYENYGFTHDTDNFNKGVLCSAYKTLPSMEEKLLGQMEIAKKVRAVDLDDVAKLVIQNHFLKDVKGNLKKFSMQKFRCVKCNEKYRRPPLSGKCTHCGGKLIFTISYGSVIKYLDPSLMLAEKYAFSSYLKQTLSLVKKDIDAVFGREKEKQTGLNLFLNR